MVVVLARRRHLQAGPLFVAPYLQLHCGPSVSERARLDDDVRSLALNGWQGTRPAALTESEAEVIRARFRLMWNADCDRPHAPRKGSRRRGRDV